MQLLASDYDGTLKQYSDKEKEPTVEKRDKEAIDEFRKEAIYSESLQDVPRA